MMAPEERGPKKPYDKPAMKVEKIHRFFFGVCQAIWPMCYSQNIQYPLQPLCR